MPALDSETTTEVEVLEASVASLSIQQQSENPLRSPPASPTLKPSTGLQKWMTTLGETAIQAKAVAIRTRNQLQSYRVSDLLDRSRPAKKTPPSPPPESDEPATRAADQQDTGGVADSNGSNQPSQQHVVIDTSHSPPSSVTDVGARDNSSLTPEEATAADAQSHALASDVVPQPEDGVIPSSLPESHDVHTFTKTKYPSTITPRFVKKQHRLQNFQGLQHALQSAVSKTAAVWETGRLFDGGILTSANTKKWYKQALPVVWVKKFKSDYNQYGNYVVIRSTGVTQWEDMPIYARIGMHIVFGSTFDHRLVNSTRIQKLFSTESIKQGHHFDAPASVAQIPHFIKTYKIDLNELEEPDPTKYATFNEFFYRKLKADARSIAEPNNPDVIVSAADCRLSVFETIKSATQIWIKGRQFTLMNLLQDANLAAQYEGGSIAIFRLAPQDYHRFHSPVQGRVVCDPIPLGKQYYTVNPMAVRGDINVFTENVRKVSVIELQQRKGRSQSLAMNDTSPSQQQEGEEQGEGAFSPDEYEPASAPFDQCVYVSIGALLVGSVQLTGAGKAGNELHKGDELGYFAYGGSTCLLLFKKGAVVWDDDLLKNSHNGLETLVRVGERIGIRE
ncbi:hypothetical protein BGW41_007519 [Actinomortierella wolfii]|nr:hypothetical protein BGW41_007519 [Actinomortierella wolfii]